MRHFWIYGCVLFLGACAADNGAGPSAAVAPPPQRQGPQIVTREAVDWTPLNPIVAIRLGGLRGSEHYADSKNPPETRTVNVELQIFPSVKSISLEAIPFANASIDCIERGQDFPIQVIASPGTDVSDQFTCIGENFTRYQITLSYSTTSKLSNGTLTIDGKGRLTSNTFGEAGHSKEFSDYAIELHGAIQISGTKCRVMSWRHDFPNTTYYDRVGAGALSVSAMLVSDADTICTVITEKKAG